MAYFTNGLYNGPYRPSPTDKYEYENLDKKPLNIASVPLGLYNEPKPIKNEPKPIKNEPKSIKNEPKSIKNEPKPIKNEPKSKNAPKTQQKIRPQPSIPTTEVRADHFRRYSKNIGSKITQKLKKIKNEKKRKGIYILSNVKNFKKVKKMQKPTIHKLKYTFKQNNNILYISNIAPTTTEEHLRNRFDHYGEILYVIIMKNVGNGNSYGAFIKFETENGVQLSEYFEEDPDVKFNKKLVFKVEIGTN